MREPRDYSTEFAEYLRSLGWEPVLIGALAAIEYRVSDRQTTDVDFLVSRLGGLRPLLEADGYEVREMAEAGSSEPYLLFVRGHGVRVDLMAAGTPFQVSVIERAIEGTASVEDVIVFKLLGWRARDRDDVSEILAGKPRLNEHYITEWAEEWGVLERWEAAKTSSE